MGLGRGLCFSTLGLGWVVMCGRYVLARSTANLADVFSIDTTDDGLPAGSYNIAPSQPIPIVVAVDDRRRLVAARWGLVPRFAKSLTSGPTPFNARVEKLETSPLYRGPFATRRAIIPADGFYERRQTDKQSFYIHAADGSPLAFAGVYEWWRPANQPDVPWLLSAAVITCDSQAEMSAIHDRQPLCLPQDMWVEWLDPTGASSRLIEVALEGTSQITKTWEYRSISADWLSTRPGQRRDDPGLIG